MERSNWRRICIGCAATAVSLSIHAPAFSQVVGAMGDSLTDEYAESEYDYALNWAQQLVIFRGLDFGPTAGEAGQPDATWGEPRRTQYEQNWARGGADSNQLLDEGQHTGLAGQIVPFEIEYALLAIGANDFAPVPLPGYAYFNIYWSLWSESQKQNYINGIVNRIAAATDTVLAAGDVHFVLATVPDYGATPIASQFFPNATNRDKVTAVIQQLNEEIEQLAAEREIVLLDIYSLGTAIFGTNHNPHDTLLLGNVTIHLTQSDDASNTNPQAGFVHDGIHPHTTLQGIFANAIAEAMNVGDAADISLFTEAEILDHAGMAYGGIDTLPASIGEWAQYIFDFTPSAPAIPGDINGDNVVNVDDLLMVLNNWGDCDDCNNCDADVTGDCTVNVDDLLLVLNNWG